MQKIRAQCIEVLSGRMADKRHCTDFVWPQMSPEGEEQLEALVSHASQVEPCVTVLKILPLAWLTHMFLLNEQMSCRS